MFDIYKRIGTLEMYDGAVDYNYGRPQHLITSLTRNYALLGLIELVEADVKADMTNDNLYKSVFLNLEKGTATISYKDYSIINYYVEECCLTYQQFSKKD